MLYVIVFVAIGLAGAFIPWNIARAKRKQRGAAKSVGRFGARVNDSSAAHRKRLPYRYADDLIFITDDAVWTGLMMPAHTDQFAAKGEAEDHAIAMARLDLDLVQILDRSVDVHDLMRYRSTDSRSRLRELFEACWNPTKMYIDLKHRESEKVDESAPDRMFMRFVRLGDWTAPAVRGPLDHLQDSITGVSDEMFAAADLEPFHEEAQRLRDALRSVGVREMHRSDLLWAIRKTFCGHLEPTDLAVVPTRPWRNGFFDLLGGFRGLNHGNHVELRKFSDSGEAETSYVASIVVVGRPSQEIFSPQSAWLTKLKRSKIRVEFSERFRLLTPADWKDLAERQINDVMDELEDRRKARAGEDAAFERTRFAAEKLKEELVTGDAMPARISRLRLQVAAPTRKELDRAVTEVVRALDNWSIVAPDEAQLLLLEEFLPGEAPKSHLGGATTTRYGGGGLGLWERTTDNYSSAVGGVASHNQVGDQVELSRGEWLGWIGDYYGTVQTTGGAFHFAPHVQVARNKGAGIAVVGASGNGKTTLTTKMFFNVTESGVPGTVLDLKNDFETYCYYLCFGPQTLEPGFEEAIADGTLGTPGSPFQPINRDLWLDTRILDLQRGARGMLDPWYIESSWSRGEALARDYLHILFPHDIDFQICEQALLEYKEDVRRAEQSGTPIAVGLKAVADRVIDTKDRLAAQLNPEDLASERLSAYRRVAGELELAMESDFARLLFGEGSTDGPQYGGGSLISSEKRRTIITMHGWMPPQEDNPAEWDTGDRFAAAAVHAVMTSCQRALHRPKVQHPRTGKLTSPPGIIFIDEAKMLIGMRTGRRLMSKILRQGRSLGWIIVIISQQAHDLAAIEADAQRETGSDTNQIATVFAFANNSLPEAVNALGLLRDVSGMPQNEQQRLARQLLTVDEQGGSLRNGVCVVRDVDKRSASVEIDVVWKELKRAAQTNPQLRPDAHSYPISADVADWSVIDDNHPLVTVDMQSSQQENVAQLRESLGVAAEESPDGYEDAYDAAGAVNQ